MTYQSITYPPSRVWGVPTTAMWVTRIGPAAAKRMLLTGDTIDGVEAARIGLVTEHVSSEQLDERVADLAQRVAAVPRNQLMMCKLLVNSAADQMGLMHSQTLATIFDGIARHTPEGMWFKRQAEQTGFKAAVQWRDSGRDIPDGDESREST